MAVLVTRPQPDDEATALSLRARGFEVLLAPMLRFEPVAFRDDGEAGYGAVVVTSANALRGLAPNLGNSRLLKLPLFAVGEHTAAAARDAGFANVIAAGGDAVALRECVLAGVKRKTLKKTSPLLYLAGTDLARDLAGELGARGFTVVTQTTYRMVPVSSLPRETCDAFAANRVEISALSLPQCCISAGVAAVVRDAGAGQVVVAASPDENALFGALDRALRPVSR